MLAASRAGPLGRSAARYERLLQACCLRGGGIPASAVRPPQLLTWSWEARRHPMGEPRGLHSFPAPAARQPALQAARGRQRRGICEASSAAVVSAPAQASLMHGLAVLVGWLVIAGSCIRSLPQIVRIVKNKSVEGLSLTSFTAELCAYNIQVAYNLTYKYPFSSYGDLVMCWLQNIIILGLMFVYGSIPGLTKAAVVLGFASISAFLFTGRCSLETLQVLQASTVVLLALGARLPQILMNVKRGNSGELSMFSTGLTLAGNLARVMTTLVLVKDRIILASAATQALLNFILLYQTIDTARQVKAARQLQPGLS